MKKKSKILHPLSQMTACKQWQQLQLDFTQIHEEIHEAQGKAVKDFDLHRIDSDLSEEDSESRNAQPV